jgi:putative heme iron utilization protein
VTHGPCGSHNAVIRVLQMEAEEEALVNRLQRQIESLLSSYKALEAKAEAKGISVKELAPLQIDSATEWVYGRSPTRQIAGEESFPWFGSFVPG